MKVRCVTINIAGLKGGWFKKRFEVLTAQLRELRPDVVALQEAAMRRFPEPHDQACTIGRVLGLEHHAFAPYGNPVEVMSPEIGGLAILSRWPLRGSRSVRLASAIGGEPDARVALMTEIVGPRAAFEVITTHLSWRPEQAELRLVQTGLIFEWLTGGCWKTGARGPILMGDMNATEEEPVIQLVRGTLRDCFRSAHPEDPGYTWCNINPMTQHFPLPDRRLDYIFAPHEMEIGDCRVVLRGDGPDYASDHFGVFAELDVPDESVARKVRVQ